MGLGKSPTTHELRPWLQVVRRVQSERGVIVQSLLCEGNYAPRVFTGLAGEIRSCLLSKRHCPKFLTTQCRQVVLSSSRTLHFSKCHSFQTSPPTHDKIPSGLAEVFTLPVLVFSFLLSFALPILSIFPLPSWTCLICCTCWTWQYFESHQNSESKSERRRGLNGLTLQKVWTPFPFDQGWVAVAWPGRNIKGRLHLEIMKYFAYFFLPSLSFQKVTKEKALLPPVGVTLHPSWMSRCKIFARLLTSSIPVECSRGVACGSDQDKRKEYTE